MNYFYLDASALAKRYAPEPGSVLMDQLFASVPPDRLYVLTVGIAEVVSVLVRKNNLGRLTVGRLHQAIVEVGTEIVVAVGLRRIAVDRTLVSAALSLILTHSLNGTDALVLRSALSSASSHRSGGDELVLLASDQRLLRAAQAEGLVTFNPETQDQAALAHLLVP